MSLPKNKPSGIPDPVAVPDEDAFEEFLEWTQEEEEAFLKILDDSDLKDENGNS
jgi:hypothetical protein